MKAIPRLQTFEDHIKAIAHFMNAQNAQNVAMFEELARVEGLDLPRITYAFVNRWADSERLVLERLRKGYEALYRGYNHIASDQNKRADQRATARGLLKILTDRNFPLTLYFMTDIITIVSDYSKKFQASRGLLIGKEEDRNAMIAAISAFKDSGGSPYLVELLSHLH